MFQRKKAQKFQPVRTPQREIRLEPATGVLGRIRSWGGGGGRNNRKRIFFFGQFFSIPGKNYCSFLFRVLLLLSHSLKKKKPSPSLPSVLPQLQQVLHQLLPFQPLFIFGPHPSKKQTNKWLGHFEHFIFFFLNSFALQQQKKFFLHSADTQKQNREKINSRGAKKKKGSNNNKKKSFSAWRYIYIYIPVYIYI